MPKCVRVLLFRKSINWGPSQRRKTTKSHVQYCNMREAHIIFTKVDQNECRSIPRGARNVMLSLIWGNAQRRLIDMLPNLALSQPNLFSLGTVSNFNNRSVHENKGSSYWNKLDTYMYSRFSAKHVRSSSPQTIFCVAFWKSENNEQSNEASRSWINFKWQ